MRTRLILLAILVLAMLGTGGITLTTKPAFAGDPRLASLRGGGSLADFECEENYTLNCQAVFAETSRCGTTVWSTQPITWCHDATVNCPYDPGANDCNNRNVKRCIDAPEQECSVTDYTSQCGDVSAGKCNRSQTFHGGIYYCTHTSCTDASATLNCAVAGCGIQ